jgi:nitrous-oxide reductase
LLEVNASQKDKDFIMAVNWKKAEEYIKAGKGKKTTVKYAHNVLMKKHKLQLQKLKRSNWF